MSTTDDTHSLHGRVVRVSSEPRTAPKGGYLFRGLELAVDSGTERLFIMFPIFAGEDIYDFPLLCWEGAQVAAFGLQLNNRLADGSVIYSATPKTDLVLEPHRLVTVTEAVEAATCIRAVDLRYRLGPGEPFWMAKGKLIHTFVEHLISRKGQKPDKIFREAYQTALPSFVAVLPGSGISVDAKDLKRDAKLHFDNLRSWLKAREGRFATAEVELDCMSTRWGLKGRADAILQDDRVRTILELKSGKVPMNDHQLQLYAYSLLFPPDGDDTRPDGCVLYSATGRAEGLDRDGDHWRRSILEGRNRVVAMRYSYTLEDRGDDRFACPRTGRCLSRKDCHRVFGGPSAGNGPLFTKDEREYYDRWFRLLSLDAWEQETEFAGILDPRGLPERVEQGITVPVRQLLMQGQAEKATNVPKEAPDTDGGHSEAGPWTRNGRIAVELSLDDGAAEVNPGDAVLLHRGDPCSEDALRARVSESGGGRILATVKAAFPLDGRPVDTARFAARFTDPVGWFLDRIPFSRARDVSRHALAAFLAKAAPKVKRVVIHGSDPQDPQDVDELDADPEIRDLCFSEGLQSELNEDQEAAIKAVLSSETFHLIHGPPGTGKTRVLARLIRFCLDRGERLLLACPTNVALDRVLVALLELGMRDFVRVGSRSGVSPEFLAACERSGNPRVLMDDLCAGATALRTFPGHIASARLVAATAYQTAAHSIFLRQQFDRVVVDEAGQLDEPSTLAALSLAPRFVLCGDHLQLPPVVKTPSEPSVLDEGRGLERSLFERLFEQVPGSRISRLKMQYRMNREVQEIPSQLFYDGLLVPAPDVATRRLGISPAPSPDRQMGRIVDPDVPVIFVDVPAAGSAKSSPYEADLACKIVETLLASGVASHEIGIITPYRAQQALVRGLLANVRGALPRLSVDTVDRFQGGEREVIILSLARSDSVTSFLADRKRLNVSLSRARSKLILLGNGPALKEHPLFEALLADLPCVTYGA
ncbi:MAG: AAA family ATPase [Desulfomonile tiedjei]|nr:AAA family ATPase [Desulfomonile tiedjei]